MKLGMDAAQNKQDITDRPCILVVDDDDRIRTLICRYLNENGFLSISAADAAEAREILTLAVFDAIVLDIMMPGQDGRAMTQDLRRSDHNDIPVIMLTAMGEADDRISGFQAGADDYLAKPFDPRELVMRLQAILRRRPARDGQAKTYKIGPWSYDPAVPELVSDSETVRLTDVEATLLKTLVQRIDTILTRDELADLCGVDSGERTIDVQVTRLRRKLEEDSKNPRYLQTVRGKGYLLRAEERERSV